MNDHARKCCVCGIDITARHGNFITCSETCRRDHRRAYCKHYKAGHLVEMNENFRRYTSRKRQEKEAVRKCCMCGTSIAWASRNRNTCSVECDRAKRRRDKRLWQLANVERINELRNAWVKANPEKVARARLNRTTAETNERRQQRRHEESPEQRAKAKAYNRERSRKASAALIVLREMELI